MVALGIITVALLGLLEVINIAMIYNLNSQLREEATNLGQKYMDDFKDMGCSNIPAPVTYPTISTATKIRGANNKLMVDRSATSLGSNTTQLQVVVTWRIKGVTYTNNVTSVCSQ